MKMKVLFTVEARISLNVTVEADTLDEAIERAKEAPVMHLCHQCAEGYVEKWSTSGDLDCDPSSARLVDVAVEGVDAQKEEKLQKAAFRKWRARPKSTFKI